MSGARRRVSRMALLPPRLGWAGSETPDALQLLLSGPADEPFHLESTADLGAGQWSLLASFLFGDRPILWREERISSQPHRFYRLASASRDLLSEAAGNFRLLDHEGKAHDLFYSTHRK